MTRELWRNVLLADAIIVLFAFLTWQFSCPCERLPGGWLTGDVVAAPVTDWRAANTVPLCQLQVSGLLPHSINLNCMADDAGRLYVSCSQCAQKHWAGIALEQPRGRIRIGSDVHPVLLRRVTAATELDHAWQVRAAKVQRGVEPRPGHWWSFELISPPA